MAKKSRQEQALDSVIENLGLEETENGANIDQIQVDSSTTLETTDQTANVIPEKTAPKAEHNWEKREADAKEAQRSLSRERNKLDGVKQEVDEKLSLLEQRKQEVQELLERLEATKSSTKTVVEDDQGGDDDEKAFSAEYPDLDRIINKKINKNVSKVVKSEVEPVKQRLNDEDKKRETRKKTTEEALETARRQEILTGILESHEDATTVANDDAFIEWIADKPPFWRDIMLNTFNYSAQDCIFVLDQYKSFVNGGKPKVRKPSPGDQGTRIKSGGLPDERVESDTYTDAEISDLPQLINRIARTNNPKLKAQMEAKLERTLQL
jgi:hypothetical protein